LGDLDQPGVNTPTDSLPPVHFDQKYASNKSTQFKYLVKRFVRLYWRAPTYNFNRLFLNIVLALLFGVMYYGLDYTTFLGIQNGAALLFMSTMFGGAMSLSNALTFTSEERPVYYKERGSNTYSSILFFASFGLVEVPYALLQVMLFSAIFFPMVGFSGVGTFFLYYMVISFYHLMMIFLGQLMALALPALNVAFAIQQLMISIFGMYMGFNPPYDSIPKGLKFLYYLSIPRYALDMVGAAIFGHCPSAGGSEIGCKELKDVPPYVSSETITVAQYVTSAYNFNYDHLWTNFAVIIGIMVLFRILGALSIKFINWQRR